MIEFIEELLAYDRKAIELFGDYGRLNFAYEGGGNLVSVI